MDPEEDNHPSNIHVHFMAPENTRLSEPLAEDLRPSSVKEIFESQLKKVERSDGHPFKTANTPLTSPPATSPHPSPTLIHNVKELKSFQMEKRVFAASKAISVRQQFWEYFGDPWRHFPLRRAPHPFSSF